MYPDLYSEYGSTQVNIIQRLNWLKIYSGPLFSCSFKTKAIFKENCFPLKLFFSLNWKKKKFWIRLKEVFGSTKLPIGNDAISPLLHHLPLLWCRNIYDVRSSGPLQCDLTLFQTCPEKTIWSALIKCRQSMFGRIRIRNVIPDSDTTFQNVKNEYRYFLYSIRTLPEQVAF